jgi:hypothetical protein
MRNTPLHQLDGSCPDPQVRLAETESNLTFEYDEDLVLGVMDVERRRVAVPYPVLENGDAVVSLLVADVDGDQRIEEP